MHQYSENKRNVVTDIQIICVHSNFNYFSSQVKDFTRKLYRTGSGMKRTAILLGMIFYAFFVGAQQDPQITQFMFNQLQVNPAFAGSREAICGTFLSREQWAGFEGAPQTNVFSVHSNFNAPRFYQNNAGVGLSFMYDQLGNISNTNVKLMYAYRHAFNFAPGYFSLGVDAGIISQSVQANWVSIIHEDLDPAIPGGISSTVFDLGLGLYYYNGNDYYAGFSAQHLLEPVHSATGTDWDFQYPKYRTYYFMLGHNKIWIPNTLTPLQVRGSAFFKSQIEEYVLDLNFNVLINNFFWVGPSLRNPFYLNGSKIFGEVSLMGGMDFGAVSPVVEGLKLGLAYDISATNNFNRYNSGSFEIMINYCYKITPPVKIRKYRTVKWL